MATAKSSESAGAEVADQVLAALKSMGARGASRARPQAEVARMAGVSVRTVRNATLVLNLRGEPVVSSTESPSGIYIAESIEELEAYAGQLLSRLRGNGRRLAAMNRMIRAWVAEESVEPGGQRRMAFA